jgi:hypothetical protein
MGRFFYNSDAYRVLGPHTPQTAYEFADNFYETNRRLFANQSSLIAERVITNDGNIADPRDPQLVQPTVKRHLFSVADPQDPRLAQLESNRVVKHRLALAFELPKPGLHWYTWHLSIVNMDGRAEIRRDYRLVMHRLFDWYVDYQRLANPQYIWDKRVYPAAPEEIYPLIHYLATEPELETKIAALHDNKQQVAEKIAILQAKQRKQTSFYHKSTDMPLFSVLANMGFSPHAPRSR